jgi:hypothetical protein
VVERAGRIRVVRNGRKLRRPFLDIRRLVQFLDRDNERRDQGGLLSLAFSPLQAQRALLRLLYAP